MRKVILVLVVLLSVPALTAQPASIDAQRASTVYHYETLRDLDMVEAKRLYVTLSADVRRNVWTTHLVTFLAAHPELTDEQHDVILQGLGLVASGIFEIERSDPRWNARVADPLQRLIAKANAVLPRELAVDAFLTLGGAESVRSRHQNRVAATFNTDCDCSIAEGFCWDSEMQCRGSRPFCVMIPNCGPLWGGACDGRCEY